MKKIFSALGSDLPSSLVVFLVALPLCLGVGLASTNVEGIDGLPNVFSGIIAGMVGGIVVGSLSGSRIGVSGPAAGLILIILGAITTLGSFDSLLLAVVLAGAIQIIAGFAGLGIIGNYFPSSVIKGMLAAIGITLILKEIPHAVGYDKDFFGDESFIQTDGHNTFSELYYAMGAINFGAVLIFVLSILILITVQSKFLSKYKIFKFIPGALIVVAVGIFVNLLFQSAIPEFYLSGKHAVELPVASSMGEFFTFFSSPDFSAITDYNVWIVAGTIALIGSLETLLCVEATDKIDPERGLTPTNRELRAQGVGNMVSGLIGGLPITQVIVRSSANINAGAKTKFSAIFHGILLFLCVLLIPSILNLIPLASLAAILIMVGYKLAKVSLFKQMYRLGWEQFIPFIGTIIGVIFTDLLIGIGIGICLAIFFILRKNFSNDYRKTIENSGSIQTIHIHLAEDVSFLNKASIMRELEKVPNSCKVVIDGKKTRKIDYDILEMFHEFNSISSVERNIQVELINIPDLPNGMASSGH